MTDDQQRQAFMQAIKDNPEDALNRCAFADWLDEHDCPEEADFHRGWTLEKYREAVAWMQELVEGEYDGYDAERSVAERSVTYEDAMQAGHDVVKGGWGFTQTGSEGLRDKMWDEGKERYWQHWEIITGIRVTQSQREETVFGCSC